MELSQTDAAQIRAVVEGYFKGAYQGDAEMLKTVFHPAARIIGAIKGEIYDWSLADFIDRVTANPAAQREKYDKEIVFLDHTGDAAMVKAKVVAGNLTFTDYITLLKMSGNWVIRNKSFTT